MNSEGSIEFLSRTGNFGYAMGIAVGSFLEGIASGALVGSAVQPWVRFAAPLIAVITSAMINYIAKKRGASAEERELSRSIRTAERTIGREMKSQSVSTNELEELRDHLRTLRKLKIDIRMKRVAAHVKA